MFQPMPVVNLPGVDPMIGGGPQIKKEPGLGLGPLSSLGLGAGGRGKGPRGRPVPARGKPALGVNIGRIGIPAVVPAVNNDARQKRIQNPGVPMSGGGHYDAMPVNFIELMNQRQLDEEGEPNVLFKYAHEVDMISEFNIEHTIFFRVCTGIVEMIVFDKARDWHLNIAGYFLNHVVGELLVNHPTQTDTAALRHIFNITNDSKSKEVGQALVRNIDESNFPIHFVCNAKFNVKYSALAHKTASKHTIRRITDAMRA